MKICKLVRLFVACSVVSFNAISANPIPSVALGVLREVVSIDIKASTIDDAVRQLIEQGGKSSEAVKHAAISVDAGLKPVAIRLKLSKVSMGAALVRIASHSNASLELDETGNILIIRRIVALDGASVKDYYIPKSVLKLVGLSLESSQAASVRLRELGIPLEVEEIDSKAGRIRLAGSLLNLKTFEMLVNSISRSGLDISRVSM